MKLQQVTVKISNLIKYIFFMLNYGLLVLSDILGALLIIKQLVVPLGFLAEANVL